MQFENTLAFAQDLDKQDELKKYREQFFFPKHEGKDAIYFTGNSLGLQPKTVQQYIQQELNDWAMFGVEGHFHAKNPWYSYHEQLAEPLAKLVGAKQTEVVAMNQLTSNIHFLFVSFYKPTAKRYKIICEAKAFPSDQYLLESQVKHYNLNLDDAIIEVAAREGEHLIRHEDILSAIEKHKNELALVFIGGVNYLTGQVFDMQSITKAGHDAGAIVGFDLAHAVGNIQLKLNEWNVDFAAWCSYKYLNSGPGSVGGAFVHEKHHKENLPRFAGWWGHDKATRFKMEKGFNPIQSAEGWQLSNAPVFSMAAHKASLDIFNEVGMEKLVAKSKTLTDYLEFIIEEVGGKGQETGGKGKKLEIITPKVLNENDEILNEAANKHLSLAPRPSSLARGCQLSIIAHGKNKDFFNSLVKNGIIADWREPNVIRVAPVPLYNSFEDCWRFGEVLKKLL